jgi:hypothetical protein
VHLKAVGEVAADLKHYPVPYSWHTDVSSARRNFNVHFFNKKELEVDLPSSQIYYRHTINSLNAQLLIIDLKYLDGVFDSEKVFVC